MIRNLVAVAMSTFACYCFAQDVSVEKSVFDIQTGLAGVWTNYEFRLSNEFTLRSEIGLEVGVVKNWFSDDVTFVLAPVISVEPRWYYNLEKRSAKGKNIIKNSGNLFSVKANLNPDSFLITNNDNINVVNQLAIIPKWGIRRVYGKHLSFETGVGLGPIIYFGKDSENVIDPEPLFIDLHLRIGYSF